MCALALRIGLMSVSHRTDVLCLSLGTDNEALMAVGTVWQPYLKLMANPAVKAACYIDWNWRDTCQDHEFNWCPLL